MALEIFKLVGSIFIDSNKANDSISKTDEKASKLGEKFVKGAGTVAKFGAAVGAAAVAGATAVGALAVKVSDTMSTIDDSSKKVGMSAEEYQKWAYAAKMGGMEMGTLEKAMIKQQKAFSDAKDGSKSMSQAYQRLGIDISKVGSSSDAFDQVIAKLADMKNETERNALANDIFGKSYAELAPMLADGSAGIAALKDEASKLGTVMSNDAVAAGAQLGDNIDKIKASIGGAVGMLVANLMPTILSISDWIIANMPQIQAIATGAFNALSNAIAWVKDNANWLIPVIAGLVAGITAMTIIGTVIKLIDMWKASTIAQTFAQGGLNAVMSANPIGLIVIAIAALVAAGIYLWKNWDTVKAKAGELWGKLSNVFDGIKNKVSDVFSNIRSWFGGLANMAKVPINSVIGFVNKAINGINKITGAINKIPGINIGKIGTIPYLAKGTDYFQGGRAIVGENGPELVNLPRGSQVIPTEQTANLMNGGMVQAFIEALKHVSVVLDDDKVGKFVDNRMEEAIYG